MPVYCYSFWGCWRVWQVAILFTKKIRRNLSGRNWLEQKKNKNLSQQVFVKIGTEIKQFLFLQNLNGISKKLIGLSLPNKWIVIFVRDSANCNEPPQIC